MKLILLAFFFFSPACSQYQERDGGWAQERASQGPAVERSSEPSTEYGTARASSTEMHAQELPQDPLAAFAPSNDENDFAVSFGGPARLIPPGLIYGLNDLRQASSGAWQAWSEAVTPAGGTMRMFVAYWKVPFDEGHIQTALRAKAAGLDLMVTAVGSSRERTGKGGKHDRRAMSKPPSPGAWTKELIRDVKRLQAAGVTVARIEIWNEPDLGDMWAGTMVEFGDWFADVGILLRKEFGHSIEIGGPGLAGNVGRKMEWCRTIFGACKKKGFVPDFYSWHHYGGYPTEHDMLQVPQAIANAAFEAGIELPELMLSEWNLGLPHPNNPGLDDQRAACHYMATVISLAQTQVSDSSFFFLQDAPWDTKREFAGESVGIYTLAGAPKSLLAGMRMMATAGDLPAVPVTRGAAPSNISLFASREGDRGYLLAVNTFGGGMGRHVTRLLGQAGVEISKVKKDAKRLQAYCYGRADRSSLRSLNLSDHAMRALDHVRDEVSSQENEKRKGMRSVRIRLDAMPQSIRLVQLLDNSHGNPIADADFQRAYEPYSKGLSAAAAQEAMDQLRGEGVSESKIAALESGLKASLKNGRGAIPGVDRATTRRAKEAYEASMLRLADEVPLTLSRHPATFAQVVDTNSWCSLKDDILEIRLPLETSVLVELAW